MRFEVIMNYLWIILVFLQGISLFGGETSETASSPIFIKPNAEQMLIVEALKTLRIKEEKNASESSENHDISTQNIKSKYATLYKKYSKDTNKQAKFDEIKKARDILDGKKNSSSGSLELSEEDLERAVSAWEVWTSYYREIKQEFIKTQKIPADAPAVILWKIATWHEESEPIQDPMLCPLSTGAIKSFLLEKPWKKSKCFKEGNNGFISTYSSTLFLSEIRQEKVAVKWASDKIVPKKGKWEYGALKRMSHLLLLAQLHNKEGDREKKKRIKGCFESYDSINGSVPPSECTEFIISVKDKTSVHNQVSLGSSQNSSRRSSGSDMSGRTSSQSVESHISNISSNQGLDCEDSDWGALSLEEKKTCILPDKEECHRLMNSFSSVSQGLTQNDSCLKIVRSYKSDGDLKESKRGEILAAKASYIKCINQARTCQSQMQVISKEKTECERLIAINSENQVCLDALLEARDGRLAKKKTPNPSYKTQLSRFKTCSLVPKMDENLKCHE